jgi:imidazolonepropionase-like amidohydrolase
MRYPEDMSRSSVGCLVISLATLAAIVPLTWLWLRPPSLVVPPPGLDIGPVTVLNPGAGAVSGRRVVVRGDRIERIDAAPPEARTRRFAGATVVPGLIDLHVHHPPSFAVGERELFALLFLAHGVTSVRDTGSLPPHTLDGHARAIAQGTRAGPRIFHCGPLLDGEPASWPGAVSIRSAADAQRAVRELAGKGASCVKLYNGLSPEAVAHILTAARASKLAVVGHVPWSVGVENLPGVEVQHLMGLSDDWNRVSEDDISRYVEQSQRLGLRHVPTLVSFARAAQLTQNTTWKRDPVSRLLPRYYSEILWRPENRWLIPPQSTQTRVETMMRVTAALHKAGVPVLAGTDTLSPFVAPGLALHEELGHLIDAGFAPAEAWMAATSLAGEALGVPGLGRLEPGAPADLLIFSKDPTRGVPPLPELLAVVAGGRLYPKEVLDRAIEEALMHFHGSPYQPISMTAASVGLSWLRRGPD